MTLADLLGIIGGDLQQGVDISMNFVGCNTLEQAVGDEVSFLANRKYRRQLAHTQAGLVLVADDLDAAESDAPLLRVADPYLAFAKLQRHFHPQTQATGQRHPSAVIAASACLADDVDVDARCVIGANVSIGAGSRIGAGCIIEQGVTIGAHCLLHAGVIVAHHCVLADAVALQAGAVIGSDGFGYAWDGCDHIKIPQVGRVVLERGVEVGANSCIDRGVLGDTVVGAGSKIDNLVQIGHNVTIGQRVIVVSQVGISGSTSIGNGCQIGGQAGIAGHLKIGDGARVAAKSGVIGNLEAGKTYAGYPAIPHRLWLRIHALLKKLPKTVKES
ncbi:MAG: UDP-3-O-(3-hydroxymyristoyl)glucosamine N-acyltransferase [Mariprofundales bacterium]|nr:UDP-3-O-(3-hydroxymyristoyl)glucosamine N-acyltransferase [Mariprofundales bacterium]